VKISCVVLSFYFNRRILLTVSHAALELELELEIVDNKKIVITSSLRFFHSFTTLLLKEYFAVLSVTLFV